MKAKFKVGDVVEIINNTMKHGFKVGDKGEITGVYEKVDAVIYRVSFRHKQDFWFVPEIDLVVAKF